MTFSSSESIVSTQTLAIIACYLCTLLSLSSTFLILSFVCHLSPSIRIYSKRAETFSFVYIYVTEDSVSTTVKWVSEVTQLCPTLCNPMDFSLPGSSVYGVFQARVLEWVAISFSRGPSRPRDQTWVSRIVGIRFTVWATREIRISAK